MSKKHKSHKQYKDYLKGKKPLKVSVLQHPEGDSLYDFMEKSKSRRFIDNFGDWDRKNKKD